MRMKREDGILISRKENVKGVWKRHFKHLMKALLICLVKV